jgi:hypothetical protein
MNPIIFLILYLAYTGLCIYMTYKETTKKVWPYGDWSEARAVTWGFQAIVLVSISPAVVLTCISPP